MPAGGHTRELHRDELVRQAIEVRDTWAPAAFERRLKERAGYAPRDMLLAMFDVLDEWFTDEKLRGCILLHVLAEFPSPTDPIHRAASKHHAVSRETIAQVASGSPSRSSSAPSPQVDRGSTWGRPIIHPGCTCRQLRGPGSSEKVKAWRVGDFLVSAGAFGPPRETSPLAPS